MNYKGVCCPVCGKEFGDGDDIVVCPECGAPHHRECYKQLGYCALEDELHQNNLSWKNPNDIKAAASVGVQTDGNGSLICPNCGLFCKQEETECPNCHFPLKPAAKEQRGRPVVENPFEDSADSENSFGGVFDTIYEDDQLGGVSAKELICLTQKNYPYYLRVFKILSANAKAKVFCWSAFFLNFVYFFYRRMYKLGALLLGFYLLSNIPSVVLSYNMVQQAIADPMLMSSFNFDMSGLQGWQLASQLLMYARFAVSLYCGFTANRYYFDHCKSQVKRVQKAYASPDKLYYQTLSSIGGTNIAAAIMVVIALAALVFAASAVMAAALL